MITEKGTVKTAAKIDGEFQKTNGKASLILGIILIVAASLLILAGVCFLISAICDGDGEWSDVLFCIIIGAALLYLGIFSIRSYKQAIKNADRYISVQENEFFQNYVISREYVNGEHLSTSKIYYDRLFTVLDKKDYFLIYNTRVTVLVVDRRVTPPQELAAIRALTEEGVRRRKLNESMQNAQSGTGAAAPVQEELNELTEEKTECAPLQPENAADTAEEIKTAEDAAEAATGEAEAEEQPAETPAVGDDTDNL